MVGPLIYLRRPAPALPPASCWVSGRLVELADLSQVGQQQVLFRGRHWVLTATNLYVRNLSSLDTAAQQRLLEKIMQARVERFLAYYQQVFAVEVARVTIRPMRTRWGSCRPDRRTITLNLHLVHLADELLEYVVIHEFVHFFARGHGKDFYALLEKHCPDWKTRRKMLQASIGG